MSNDKQNRAIDSLRKHLERIGIYEYLFDDNVIELMLNPDGWLWIESFDKGIERKLKISSIDADIIIRSTASFHHTTVDKEKPVLECEFPLDGSRFEGVVPPITANTSFTIRKKATRVFKLDDYVTQGTINIFQKKALIKAIAQRKNILIVGGTGSGKTTFANAMIAAMVEHNPDDRITIIEDTNEIQCSAENSVIMRTNELANVTMTKLLRVLLRYRPDRILIGEVRGGEALDLLKAWNTGHPGGCVTIHANSALQGLERLEQCIEEVSTSVNRKVIASTVNLVVFIKKTAKGREIKEIIEVTGYNQTTGYQYISLND